MSVLLRLLLALLVSALGASRTGAPGRGGAPVREAAYAVTDLGTLPGYPGSASVATGINARGQVVGYADGAVGTAGDTVRRAFRTSATGTLAVPGADLGTLPDAPGGDSEARAINARGQIVGDAYTGPPGGADNQRAILYDDGARPRLRDLNALIPAASGVVLGAAVGINDAGQIVAIGEVHGRTHAFRLTPVGPARPAAAPTR